MNKICFFHLLTRLILSGWAILLMNISAEAASTSQTLTTQLTRCQTHLTAQRLLTNEQGQETAYSCYREVLAQDPENVLAQAGLQMITQQYEHWVRQSIEQRQWAKAALYLERLAIVTSNSQTVIELRQQYRQQQLADLLDICQAHQQAKRLLTGSKGTAYACYQEVLQLDPYNATAKAGLAAIAEQYYIWAEAKLAQSPAQASMYVQRLELVAPNHPALARLQAQLNLTTSPISVPSSEHNDTSNHAPIATATAPTANTLTPTIAAIPPKVRQLNHWQEPLTHLQFIEIPAGCFDLGSPETEPERFSNESLVPNVCVKSFWLSDSEVTNAQYRLFQAKHHSRHYLGQNLNGEQQPVVYVTWAEAQAFAEWLGRYHQGRYHFRLPTEAEWEYAARAGNSQARFWDNIASGHDCEFANVNDSSSLAHNPFNGFSDWKKGASSCDDGFAVTAPVKRFYPNAFGLYDMLGNVWEWTCSAYMPTQQHRADLAQHCGLITIFKPERVIKGGAWGFRTRFIRAAARYPEPMWHQTHYVGFRLVRE